MNGKKRREEKPGPRYTEGRAPLQQVTWYFKGTMGRSIPFSWEEAKRSKEKEGLPHTVEGN